MEPHLATQARRRSILQQPLALRQSRTTAVTSQVVISRGSAGIQPDTQRGSSSLKRGKLLKGQLLNALQPDAPVKKKPE